MCHSQVGDVLFMERNGGMDKASNRALLASAFLFAGFVMLVDTWIADLIVSAIW